MRSSLVLGLSFDVYITSACLLKDGEIVAACPEERLNREKLSKRFPQLSIEYCLESAGCTFSDIDYVAVGWNPGIHVNHFNSRFSAISRWRGEQLVAVPNHLLQLNRNDRIHTVLQEFVGSTNDTKILYVDHHKAHAASFYLSPFQESAIITCDGHGEEDCVTWGVGRGASIEELGRQVYPHSLGMLYGTVTQFLGFKRDSDEWKVMALYSYNVGKKNPYLDKMRRLVQLLPGGRFELDLNYFSFYLHDVRHWYTSKFCDEFGPPRLDRDRYDERHFQIAHALQLVTEEVLAHVGQHVRKSTGLNDVVLSGGIFMNSVFNGRAPELTGFQTAFIPPCPDDSGVSIGAALYASHQLLQVPRKEHSSISYLGPEYSNESIKSTLAGYKISAEYVEDIESLTARLLADGLIIGWFQGKMEFGQRALGNRSILADPRRAEMKDELNARIKYREWFRPFAPAILKDHLKDYFEMQPDTRVPYMERVLLVKESARSKIPAVTHVDGSGRLQTVDPKENSRFARLLSEFHALTGVPVLVNTSFNLNGEPIVCSPTDAIRTFFSCGLDALVLGNYLISKSRIL